jgi:nitrate reductase gamma subunit
MNDTSMQLLLWARGTGFNLAVACFLFGMTARLAQILMLGRKPDFSEARGTTFGPGIRMIWTRFWATPGMMKTSPVTHIAGHVFHTGLLLVVIFFIPHIEVFKAITGLSWPGLPTPVIDAITVITMVALLAVLHTRLTNPVRRALSGFQDYFTWAVTFAPLLTGYLAYHRLIFPYTDLLAVHILSVELLLVVIPFTKLSHVATLFLSRWYNGAMNGRKGVQL